MKEEESPRNLWARISAKMEPVVFFGAGLLVVLLVAFSSAWTETAQTVFGATRPWIAIHRGWFYVLTTAGTSASISSHRHRISSISNARTQHTQV